MTTNESIHGDDESSAVGGTTIPAPLRTIIRYRWPIALGVLAVLVAYVLAAAVFALTSPVQRSVRLGFRLEFPGAQEGRYPNGVKFSGGDIIDAPILRSAYDANGLQRFMPFGEFSRSVVVLESNDAFQALAREYEAKLSNPRLSAVDRERLEAEFAQKKESLRKNDYSLIFTTSERLSAIPKDVREKALYDVLRNWADFAANTRRVLVHRVPLVSEQGLEQRAQEGREPLTALLELRIATLELRRNLAALQQLPGAEVTRSLKRNVSLADLDLELAQIERSDLEYLIIALLNSAAVERGQAAGIVQTHLNFDRRALAVAEQRVSALRAALDDYLRSSRQREAEPGTETEPATGSENVAPQLSDSFLDRIVTLAQDAADRDYRRKLADDIREASLETVPLHSRVRYEEWLLDQMAAPRAAENGVSDITQRQAAIVTRLRAVAADLNSIRDVLSRGLTASGQMYTVTEPPVTITDRAVSTSRLALLGVLLVIAALVISVAAALIHDRLRGVVRSADA